MLEAPESSVPPGPGLLGTVMPMSVMKSLGKRKLFKKGKVKLD